MAAVALVTGGARRIGGAMVRHLHSCGFDIALHYRYSVEDAQLQTVAKAPLKRLGDPLDIARTVSFLATEAPFITGQVIMVDGSRRLIGLKFKASLYSRYLALVALVSIVILTCPANAAAEKEEIEEGAGSALQVGKAPTEEAATLRFYDLLSPCSGGCLLTGAYGRYVETSMTDIFFDPQPAPWDWDYGDIDFASITFGRKLADYGHLISLEPEVGAGKRFGDADEYEFWGALYLRWNPFFWDHIVDTSVAVSTGVTYASQNNELEEDRARSNATFLHYFSPEITLAPPGDGSISFVIRLHHRSGAGGIFGESGGFQYLMFGLRAHF